MPSSAVAAKYAKENKNILCIVNSLAVEKYKLRLQKKDIQDYSDNKTRFLVIGQNDLASTGKDKTSFLIQTTNTPGALINILRPFEKRKINLSRLKHDRREEILILMIFSLTVKVIKMIKSLDWQ